LNSLMDSNPWDGWIITTLKNIRTFGAQLWMVIGHRSYRSQICWRVGSIGIKMDGGNCLGRQCQEVCIARLREIPCCLILYIPYPKVGWDILWGDHQSCLKGQGLIKGLCIASRVLCLVGQHWIWFHLWW
jgi:hypothetical protein